MEQKKKVKFHYIELKKFNKLSHKLPENVMAVFAHNKKWFPILPEFFDIKSEIIKMVTEVRIRNSLKDTILLQSKGDIVPKIC
jgi:hypothetical protein